MIPAVTQNLVSINFEEQSEDILKSRLAKTKHCCNICLDTWKTWGDCFKKMSSIDKEKNYEVIKILAENITKASMLNRSFKIDSYADEMKKDGSVKYLSDNGINQADVTPKLFADNSKLNNFFSLIDKDISGAAKKLVYHLYSKVTMARLTQNKLFSIFILHTLVHRNYNPENNGLYPLLKSDGSIYKINEIRTSSTASKNLKRYPSEQVMKFISSKLTPQQRAEHYNHLYVKNINAAHLPEHEALLAGQSAVFASQDIPSGRCLGVHGGTIVNFKKLSLEYDVQPHDLIQFINQDYLIDCNEQSNKHGFLFLDGNNIISKINTLYCLNNNQKWVQSPRGYNTESVAFKCNMDDGATLSLHAIFTTRQIKQDEEIRLDYGYEPELVKQSLNTAKMSADKDIEDIKKLIIEHTS